MADMETMMNEAENEAPPRDKVVLQTDSENEKVKRLCLNLMKADSQKEIESIIRNHNESWWNNLGYWRNLGDNPSNLGSIDNKMEPAMAIVEKITNSVDAILVKECLKMGIDPKVKSSDRPETMQKAIEKFIEPGNIRDWHTKRRGEIAKRITISATGTKKAPCFIVSDDGEGQTPDMMPDTFLSINGSNKNEIPFVQGRYNKGGTSSIRFCGKPHHMQFLLTRRSPELLDEDKGKDDNKWGFTVIRKFPAKPNEKNDVYRYLAPLGATENPSKGGVLRFSADELPIFPATAEEGKEPRYSKSGSFVKMYEYMTDDKMLRAPMSRNPGPATHLNTFLPYSPLPIFLQECRSKDVIKKTGDDWNIDGLANHLHRDTKGSVEEGFPKNRNLSISGKKVPIEIFAIKADVRKDLFGNKSIRDRYKIFFSINGQLHGNRGTDFVERILKLPYIKEHLFIFIDCSNLTHTQTNEMFGHNRDNLYRASPVYKEINEGIKEYVDGLEILKELNEKRRAEKNQTTYKSKDTRDFLKEIIESSPSLKAIALPGMTFTNKSSHQGPTTEYEGKYFPTYFEFMKKQSKSIAEFEKEQGKRFEIRFKTDATNDYFDRENSAGEITIEQKHGDGGWQLIGDNSSPYYQLHDGKFSFRYKFSEDINTGNSVDYRITISDDNPERVEDFVKRFKVKCLEIQEPPIPPVPPGPPKPKTGINLPDPLAIDKQAWDKHGFTQNTALKIEGDDYKVNVDNSFLDKERRSYKKDEQEKTATLQFQLANVLMGMALTKANEDNAKNDKSNGNDGEHRDLDVEQITRALAPVVLPIIRILGNEDSLSKLGKDNQDEPLDEQSDDE